MAKIKVDEANVTTTPNNIQVDTTISNTEVVTKQSITAEVEPDSYVIASQGYSAGVPGWVSAKVAEVVQESIGNGTTLAEALDKIKTDLMDQIQLGVNQAVGEIENAYVSNSTLTTTLASEIGASRASILDSVQTYADDTQSVASDVNALKASFGNDVSADAINAFIGNIALTRATSQEAFASTVDTLTASYNGLEPRITSTETVVAGQFTEWDGSSTPKAGMFKVYDGSYWNYVGGTLGEFNDGWMRTDRGALDAVDILDTSTTTKLTELQNQIDNTITTWFYDYSTPYVSNDATYQSINTSANLTKYDTVWVVDDSNSGTINDNHMYLYLGVDTNSVDLTQEIYPDTKRWALIENTKPNILNLPASNWTDDATRTEHIGDLAYDNSTGFGYRFVHQDINDSPDQGIIWTWVVVADTDITQALAAAAAAQDTADHKRNTFGGVTPPIGYNTNAGNYIDLGEGDLWIPSADYVGTGTVSYPQYKKGELYVYSTYTPDGSTTTSLQWQSNTKYTDDQYAKDIETGTKQIDLSQHINSLGWTNDTTLDNFLVATYAKDMLNISNQIDGVSVTYFQSSVPYDASTALAIHAGDVWYKTSNETAYKFVYKTLDADGNEITPSDWQPITNSFLLNSLKNASKTKAAADRSIKNYTTVPTTPYYVGDTWMQGVTGDIYTCKTERLTGTFSQDDWIKSSKYTDDSTVISLQTGLDNGTVEVNLSSATIDGTVPLTTYVSNEIDKQVVVYSGTNHSTQTGMKLNDIYIEKTVDNTGAIPVDVINTYKYNGSSWIQIGNNSNITALADLADGKRTVFAGSITPEEQGFTPVERDLWIPDVGVIDYLAGKMYLYNNGWHLADKEFITIMSETFENGIDNWSVNTGNTIALETSDVYAGNNAVLITSTTTNPSSTGLVTGVHTKVIDNGLVTAGTIVEIKVKAKQPTSNASSQFAMAYSTASVGNSGWHTFTPTTTWDTYSFTFNIPDSNTNNDYFGIWGDTAGGGKGILIDNITIKVLADSSVDTFANIINPKVDLLSSQIDNKIEYYFQDYGTTTPYDTTGFPTGSFDAEDRAARNGDIIHFTNTTGSGANESYRYDSSSNTWLQIKDKDALQALEDAAQAQSTADGKLTRYYQSTAPTSGMHQGDQWTNSTTQETYVYDSTNNWVPLNKRQGRLWNAPFDSPPVGASINDIWVITDRWYLAPDNSSAGKQAITSSATYTDTNGSEHKLKHAIKVYDGKQWVLQDYDSKETIQISWVGAASKLLHAPDGSVTGWEFADGSGSQSEFKINADRFSISDGNNTNHQPFIIDTATGLSQFNGIVSFSNAIDTAGYANDELNESIYTVKELAISAGLKGAIPAYSNTDPDTVMYSSEHDSIDLYSPTDNNIGIAFPAVEIPTKISGDSTAFNMSVQIKSNGIYSSGAYIRIYEYDADLPAGKTHISSSANTSEIQASTSHNYGWYENKGVGTDWQTISFNYVPTVGVKFFSVVILNWSGIGTDHLYIKNLKITPDITAVTTDSIGAETPDGAQTKADNAKTDAITVMESELSAVADDDILSVQEKGLVHSTESALIAEENELTTFAVTYGVDSLDYSNSINALSVYLSSLIDYADVTKSTNIVKLDFLDAFSDVYTNRSLLVTNLLNSVDQHNTATVSTLNEIVNSLVYLSTTINVTIHSGYVSTSDSYNLENLYMPTQSLINLVLAYPLELFNQNDKDTFTTNYFDPMEALLLPLLDHHSHSNVDTSSLKNSINSLKDYINVTLLGQLSSANTSYAASMQITIDNLTPIVPKVTNPSVQVNYSKTTIDGNKITTGKIQSFDSNTYFDLDNNQIKMNNGNFTLDSTASGTSTNPNIQGGYIKGATLEGATITGATIDATTDITSPNIYVDKVRITPAGYPTNTCPIVARLLESRNGDRVYVIQNPIVTPNYSSGFLPNRISSVSPKIYIQSTALIQYSNGLVHMRCYAVYYCYDISVSWDTRGTDPYTSWVNTNVTVGVWEPTFPDNVEVYFQVEVENDSGNTLQSMTDISVYN